MRGNCCLPDEGMTPEQAARAEWGDFRGDYWRREWVRRTRVGQPVLSGLVVEIRAGEGETATLVASSVEARVSSDVARIDITDTDLSANLIVWSVSPAETLKIPVGDYLIEFDALANGQPDTIMPARRWTVRPQVAVRP